MISISQGAASIARAGIAAPCDRPPQAGPMVPIQSATNASGQRPPSHARIDLDDLGLEPLMGARSTDQASPSRCNGRWIGGLIVGVATLATAGTIAYVATTAHAEPVAEELPQAQALGIGLLPRRPTWPGGPVISTTTAKTTTTMSYAEKAWIMMRSIG